MDYMPKEGNYEHHSWFSSENYIDFKTQTTRMSEWSQLMGEGKIGFACVDNQRITYKTHQELIAAGVDLLRRKKRTTGFFGADKYCPRVVMFNIFFS